MTFSPCSVANLSSVSVPAPKNKARPHYNLGPRTFGGERPLPSLSSEDLLGDVAGPCRQAWFQMSHRSLEPSHSGLSPPPRSSVREPLQLAIASSPKSTTERRSLPFLPLSLTNHERQRVAWCGMDHYCFDSFMLQLGKTNMTPQDIGVLDLRPHMLGVIQNSFRGFLPSLKQMEDNNKTRLARF